MELDRHSLSRRGRIALIAPVLACLAITAVAMVLLWPDDQRPRVEVLDVGDELVDATVLEVRQVPCVGTEDLEVAVACDGLVVELTSGSRAGEVVTLRNIPVGTLPAPVEEGTGVVLGAVDEAPEGFDLFLVDIQRTTPLVALVLVFAVLAVVLGRWQGLRALVGLAASLGVVFVFVLPAISSGHDPVTVAIVGGAAVAIPALYLAHGFSLSTTVAVLGTFASLVLTGLLAWVAVAAGSFTGLAGEEVLSIQAFAEQVDIRGLLLAGMVIGAIGVLDDVTVTQVAAVREVRRASPHATAVDLYRAGVRVGRDHIAATVNTLVLAYAGAALPLLLLLTDSALPLGQLLTSEVVAVEIVRSLVGAIGIMAAVPLTTALAAVVLARHADPALEPGT